MIDEDDNVPRGVAFGLLIAIPCWLLIGYAACWLLR